MDYSQYNVTDDPPSPPKKKRRVDLKRRPSVGRIDVEKYKTKPLNLPCPVRRRKPTTSNTPVTTSTETQPVESSTSSVKGTVMKPATQKETDEVINQLLDIDMHPEDTVNDEYDVPLAPNQIQVQPSEQFQRLTTTNKILHPMQKAPTSNHCYCLEYLALR